MVRNEIENQIPALPTLSEILLGVINDPISTDGSHHVHISRTAYRGNLCAEGFGDLDRECTHASRRSINQNFLPRLDLAFVAKPLQCGECRNSYRARLLKRHAIRLHGQSRLGSTRILGKRPAAGSKHCVAWLELGYVLADRFNLASHVMA